MAWIAITAEMLQHTKVAALVDALRSAALGEGESDPVDDIAADVVAEIRTAIATAGGSVDASGEDTVPPSLVRMACRLILWEAKGRLELDRTMDEMDHREDLRRLDRVRQGKELVEQPDEAETLPVMGGAAVVIGEQRTRVANQGGLNGLL